MRVKTISIEHVLVGSLLFGWGQAALALAAPFGLGLGFVLFPLDCLYGLYGPLACLHRLLDCLFGLYGLHSTPLCLASGTLPLAFWFFPWLLAM